MKKGDKIFITVTDINDKSDCYYYTLKELESNKHEGDNLIPDYFGEGEELYEFQLVRKVKLNNVSSNKIIEVK